ncbi:helix-turn-helix domain-containing protein [Neobacillus vireti]|uniref:GH39 family glycosyl hydrolase n=1 Tax=Neobacillus vireti TaxID=220686 RepID=UPI002FFF89E3
MNFTYEIIEMNKELPLHIFLNSVDYVTNHWHDSIEVIFVLKGKVNVSVNDKRFELNEKDVFLINANDIHSIQHQDQNLLLTIQLPIPELKENIKDVDAYVFSCKSFLYDESHQAEFNELRSLLAQMMWVINKEGSGYELQIKSLYFQLIYLLIKNFKEETEKEKLSSQKHIERLLRITSYVKDNFKQQITLNELSQIEFLSVHYLSKFIQKHLGMPFSKYVDSIRLDHAVKDIVFTDFPLTQIALDNGFASVKAFNRAFKEFYHQTPSEYRRAVEMEPKKTESNKVILANYVEIDKTQAFDQLFAFLPSNEQALVVENKAVLKKTIKVNVAEKARKLAHTWKNLMTVGKAKECLYTDVQNQLKMLKDSTNFKYLRFHGIFDDEMMVYGENEQGLPEYNFLYADKVIEFLRSIRVRPFIELGFMPRDLAESNDTVFYKESNVSKPKDIEKWNDLLKAFIGHYENLYGEEEVLQWYFEVWNEPDFYVFWRGTFDDYCTLYKNTYNTIKEINPHYKVGGPSIVSINNSDWLERFLEFCREESCIPDFISFHNYSHDEMDVNKKKNVKNENAMDFGYISRDESFLKKRVADLKQILLVHNLENIDIHLTEWNSTAYHRDLTNDTSFKAAFIVKNLLENIDSIQSFGYWTITDLIEERRAAANVFHGGLGLISNHNIPKPAFFAYQLLGKLGHTFISQGDGYFFTKSSTGYQLLLYHYCHYDRLYCMNQHANIDLENRYNVFLEQSPIELKFFLIDLKKGIYKVRQYQLNRKNGSSFDKWVEMGAPKQLTSEEISYLKASCLPKLQISEVRIEEDYILTANLEPHEVQLYEIIPQKTL